jgi:hypothetical protein
VGVHGIKAHASVDAVTPTGFASLATSPLQGEVKEDYAASALAGFSGGVIAPDTLISATSLSE